MSMTASFFVLSSTNHTNCQKPHFKNWDISVDSASVALQAPDFKGRTKKALSTRLPFRGGIQNDNCVYEQVIEADGSSFSNPI
jgi:hypothetical protein